jgi:hypothetical protein
LEYTFPNLALGHAIDLDPRQLKPGNSIRSYDVNLDTIGGVSQRTGIKYISENPACGLILDNGSGAWTSSGTGEGNAVEEKEEGTCQGGTLSTMTLDAADGATIDAQYVGRTLTLTAGTGAGSIVTVATHDAGTKFVSVTPNFSAPPTGGSTEYEITPIARATDADGTQEVSRRAIYSGAQQLDNFTPTVVTGIDLSVDEDEWIGFWIYAPTASLVTNLQISISTGDNTFTDFFAMTSLQGNLSDGWTFLKFQKSEFAETGSPDWTDTYRASFRIGVSAATYVIIDNYWLGPVALDGLFNFRRSPAKGGGNWIFGAGRGCISVWKGESENYFDNLVTDWDRDKVVNFAVINDLLYAVQEGQRPKLILDDTTVYDAGIVAPTSAGTITVESAEQIDPDTSSVIADTHTIAVVFFSTITGLESNPVFSADFDVANDNSRLAYSNLPVSTDPKVTHLRIYRRAPGEPGYKRVDTNLEGTVTNGTTTYQDTAANTSLGALLEGAPDYTLNGIPPNAGVAGVSNDRVIYNDPTQQGRIFVSRRSTGEQVPLTNSVPIDEGDNDIITAIHDIWGYAVVFKRDSIFVGRAVGGLQPFAFQKRSNKIGTLSHRSVIVSENIARFRHSTGYYDMNPAWQPRKLSAGWDHPSLNQLAEPNLKNFSLTRGDRVTSAFLTDRDQIYWTETIKPARFPSIQPVFHEPLQEGSGWVFHRAPVSVIAPARDIVTNEEEIIGAGDAGFVYRLDQGGNSDTLLEGAQAIDLDYMTPYLDAYEARLGAGPRVLKQYRYIDMVMRPGGNWPLDYEVYYDWSTIQGGTDSGSLTPSASAGGAIGVTFAIGVSAIGPAAGEYQRAGLSMGRHRSVAIRWRNNRVDEAPYISSFYVWLNVRRLGERAL